MNERYTFVVNGQSSSWIYKPLKQAAQIARKEKGISHQLWNLFKRTKSILYHRQELINNIWEYRAQNRKLI